MPVTATRAGARRTRAFDLQAYLENRTERINQALDQFLPKETVRPETIHRAMRYSLFAGGKRLRPALCLAAATACGGHDELALPLACAVECRSEEHTSELQSRFGISYAVFCLKKKKETSRGHRGARTSAHFRDPR